MRVLIMGAGLVGVATAYQLAKEGHEVTVLDRHPAPASETSFANAGLVAPGHAFAWGSPAAPKILLKSLFDKDQALRVRLSPDPRMWQFFWRFLKQCTAERARINTLRKIRLCLYSQACLQELKTESGIAYDGQEGGLLYLYRSQQSFDAAALKSKILRDGGVTVRVLDRDGTVALDPALAPRRDRIAGALFVESDESGDACLFTRGLARLAGERYGVVFEPDTTIQRIAIAGGHVEKVLTDRGDFAAEAYVMALGAQAPALAAPIGLSIPTYPVKGYSMTIPVAGRSGVPARGGVDEDNLLAFCPMGERVRFTSTAEFSGYDTTHRPSDFTAMIAKARDLYPEAGDYNDPSYWACLRPMTPEGAPIYGGCRYENLWLNLGQGHMGWTMAWASARITADLMAGRRPEIPLDGMTLDNRA